MATGWEPAEADVPIAPQNGQCASPYLRGVTDLRWDDPSILAANSIFTVVGVNVYRSDASDRGPFFRINDTPVGGNFYRDFTHLMRVDREVVHWDSSWVFKGDGPNDKIWQFRTTCTINKAVDVAPGKQATYGNSPSDVTIYIDGVAWPAHRVFGNTGEVTLVNRGAWDPVTEKFVPFPSITADTDVEISYWTVKNHVQTGLDRYPWYRLTTVVRDSNTPSGFKETPLEFCKPLSLAIVEEDDYIWREGVRRNQWIALQGGERVHVFIRKTAGVRCTCGRDAETLEFNKKPDSRCEICFGTGFVGGYEGPYPIIIGPDDAERRIAQTDRGRRMEHTFEVWTGPSPFITQRDFIVKQTNERYSVGPVRRPSNRGNLLQQHFSIGYLDEADIRYKVPVDGVSALPWKQSTDATLFMPAMPVDGKHDGKLDGQKPWPVGPEVKWPHTTEKSNIPDEREVRGSTRTWENQNN